MNVFNKTFINIPTVERRLSVSSLLSEGIWNVNSIFACLNYQSKFNKLICEKYKNDHHY